MRKRRSALLLLSLAGVVAALLAVGCGSSETPLSTTNPGPGSGGGGPAPAAVLALLPAAQRGATYVGNDTCGSCHAGNNSRFLAPELDLATFRASAHGQARVDCEHCHGPGSAHATAPATDNIIGDHILAGDEVCAACHGATVEQYRASAHSHEVEAPAGRQACMPCHDAAYRLVAVDQPQGDGLTQQQINDHIATISEATVAELAEVNHASVSCANCHNPHARTGNTTPDGNDPQLRSPLTQADPSQVPALGAPLADWIDYPQGCAKCHMGGSSSTSNPTDARLKSGSNQARPMMHDNPQYYVLMGRGGVEQNAASDDDTDADLAQHSALPGQCASCHMPGGNHTMHVDYGVSCAPCHSAAQAEALVASQHAEVTGRLAALVARMEQWAQQNLGNAGAWDHPTPVAQLPIELLRARHNYYLLVRDLSGGVHNSKYTDELLDVAEANLTALGIPPAAAPAGARLEDLERASRAHDHAELTEL